MGVDLPAESSVGFLRLLRSEGPTEPARSSMERTMPMSPKTKAEQQWKSGVYIIRNTVNGKVYVGSAARSTKRRWIDHRMTLRGNRHRNRHLQSAWNKYGEESFTFSVLVWCAPEDCVRYEQTVIDEYNAADRQFGYNSSPTAGSCLGTKLSDETRAKMSKVRRGRKRPAEVVAKCAAAQKGIKRSAETKAKLSAARKNNKVSNENIKKAIAANTGKKLSDEHKAKLVDAAKNRSGDCYEKAWATRRFKKMLGGTA